MPVLDLSAHQLTKIPDEILTYTELEGLYLEVVRFFIQLFTNLYKRMYTSLRSFREELLWEKCSA